MAWSESRIFSAFLDSVLTNAAPFDLEDDTLKIALFNNSITPDADAAAAATAYNAGQWAVVNEVDDGTNWDTGGEPLTTVAVSSASGVVAVDADDTPQGGASTTLAGVYGGLLYSDTLTTPVADQGIAFFYFGGEQTVTANNFTVVWATGGFIQLDLT